MIVNQLTTTNSSRLNQIMHTLKHVHRFELSAHERLNLSETQQHYEGVKKQIVETSEFNSYHTNPEYTKAALITEAVKLLKEIAPSRRKTVKEHQELAESMHKDKKVSQDTYKEGDKVRYTDDKGDTTDCIVAKFTKGPMIGLKINGKIDMVHKSQVSRCSVEEGFVKNIKNGLRRKVMMEDESLDKAETILAAKDLSDKLQNMAEDAAKMAVDKLMPLVDVMKSQFGQDPADGFNSVVKAQLQTVLDAIIAAKDETDNAIMALQDGQTPGMTPDVSPQIPSAEPSAEMPEFGQDLSAAPDTAEPEQEPLGRTMKSPMSESKFKFAVGDLVQFEYAKNMKLVKGKVVAIVPVKKTSQNPYGYMVDVKSGNTIYRLHPDHPQKLMEPQELGEATPTPAQQLVGDLVGGMLKNNKNPKTNRPPTPQERKAAEELTKDTQAESKINNLKVVIESLKTEFNNLKHELNAHREVHQQAVMEGSIKDVTQVGYGLEGAAILHKMNHVKSKIQETQERLTAIVQQVQAEQKFTHMTNTKITALREQAQHMPYGIVGVHTTGTKFKKFFESADHRQLWLEYNQSSLAHKQMINPEDLARIRHRLKGTI
jgi:hypothetical protein